MTSQVISMERVDGQVDPIGEAKLHESENRKQGMEWIEGENRNQILLPC